MKLGHSTHRRRRGDKHRLGTRHDCFQENPLKVVAAVLKQGVNREELDTLQCDATRLEQLEN